MSLGIKLVIFAAGRGLGLDGFQKLKLVSPSTGESIIERYCRQLSSDVTVVVGYRAPEIMSQYPNNKFIYNPRWFETGSAFSAAQGLTDSPSLVCPCDLFLCDRSARAITESAGNVIFTVDSENRPTEAVNVAVEDGRVARIYQGSRIRGEDLEFTGIARIEDQSLLEDLVNMGRENPYLAFSDCLEHFKSQFRSIELPGTVVEINRVEDYVKFFEEDTVGAPS